MRGHQQCRWTAIRIIRINGSDVHLPDDPRVSVLDLLRDYLQLPGVKKGCNQGACGACTVLVEGKERILACMALAVQYERRSITSIEGLAGSNALHPLQRAFIEHDGFQCGYCTPGQICSGIGMIEELKRGVPSHVTDDLSAKTIALSREEIQERMSGNLCRCGAYNGIIAAIVETQAEAVQLGAGAQTKYLGGGTNLVDLLRETLEQPAALVDITALPDAIEDRADGSLLIGAAAKNTAVAEHRAVRMRFPVLTRAISAGASAQIRNMATVGGNILQRTRCTYFYDHAGSRCNKRSPGEGCDAIEGFNRNHAVLGASSSCIATHPSDMCVALAALGAVVHLRSSGGTRTVLLTDLHRLPGTTPEVETVLEPGELITAVEIPALSFAARSTYRKVRDRASYAFALISIAAAIDIEDGVVKDIRLALGGMAAKPWRAWTAEAALKGQPATTENFRAAAEAELAAAQPLRDNGFKVALATRTIVAVLDALAGNTDTEDYA
ncbi:MAG: hypothetical protein WDW38_008602 [Sanguina aurantia]